jgi:hypothetical protein
MTLEQALTAALDDEYRARATYRAVLDAFGDVRPFSNIVESEERHIEALCRLCDRHGVEVPPDEWPSRVSAPESLQAACEAAVEAERENAGLYAELMAAEGVADRPDVEETFRNLLSASQDNHLPAFERAVAREGRGGGGGPVGAHGGRGRHRRRHRGGRTSGDREEGS